VIAAVNRIFALEADCTIMAHVILEQASDNARMGFTRYSLELFPVMEAHNACHNQQEKDALWK
jgi:hypothetical protein